jgi:hypothetical protein
VVGFVIAERWLFAHSCCLLRYAGHYVGQFRVFAILIDRKLLDILCVRFSLSFQSSFSFLILRVKLIFASAIIISGVLDPVLSCLTLAAACYTAPNKHDQQKNGDGTTTTAQDVKHPTFQERRFLIN